MAIISKRTANRPASVRSYSCALSLAVCALFCSSANAQGWEIEPSVYVATRFTNNLELQADEFAEDEFILEVAPGLSISKEGDRFNAALDYRLQELQFTRESDRNQRFHQLDTSFNLEPIREHFSVEGEASVSQVIVDPALVSGLGNFSTAENRTDAITYGLTPRLNYGLGSFADWELSYAFQRIDYRDTDSQGRALEDADRGVGSFILGNGARGNSFIWQLRYANENVEYEVSPRLEIESATAEIGYQIGIIQPFVSAGVETDLEDLNKTGGLDASTWSVGFRVETDKQLLEASFGERYFGDTYSFSWSRTARVLELSAQYFEGPSTTVARFLARELPIDQSVIPIDNATRIAPEVFLSKRADFDVALNFRRTSVEFSFADDRREVIGLNDTRRKSASVSFSWSLSDRSSLFSSVGYVESEDLTLDNNSFIESEDTSYSIGWALELLRSASLEIDYLRFERRAEQFGLDDIIEDRGTVQFTYRF